MADRRSIRQSEPRREAVMLFPTTIAGSLPKPEWLAEPNTLWAPWKTKGKELTRATRADHARTVFRPRFYGKDRGHRFRPQGRNGHPQGSLQGDGAAGGRPA